jgi:hypothetical protein
MTLGLSAAALLLGAALWYAQARSAADEQRLGLFTTLPILWNEAADVADLLRQDQPAPHWARQELAHRGALVPLDLLAGPKGRGPLADVDLLVMAQPRPLSPDENFALDQWVKAGGHLLLLADPALTQESAFGLADPRRPQAVVLLSPILRHWGLELEFDDQQPFGERRAEVMEVAVPVNLPGRFRTKGQANCRLWSEGLAVTCKLGKGRLVALADAAVLEPGDADGARRNAFAWLLEAATAR